ncbi:hypothetical protein E4N83_04500 [Treponema denticola]|uniref:hypothetical protein n=1 Tax=Treponema denticola TaxID=158 RepID=UPI0020A473E9|nr:hypothetical protein [Treponema denticola]UTC97547.1 hypothetical protein E4N83_04500 [Treponema denticola]
MSKSIHTTYKIFKNKSKKEIIEMCDLENPDYKVEELRKKQQIKKEVKIARKITRIKNETILKYY